MKKVIGLEKNGVKKFVKYIDKVNYVWTCTLTDSFEDALDISMLIDSRINEYIEIVKGCENTKDFNVIVLTQKDYSDFKVISLLERFKEDLKNGWDNAFEKLQENYQNELTFKENDYMDLFYHTIKLYYHSYRFAGNTHIDSGITFLIREQQKDLLLNLLNKMKESEEK